MIDLRKSSPGSQVRHLDDGTAERTALLPAGYLDIGGGYSFAELRVGMVVRNRAGMEIYCQPGDDTATMLETIAALDEVSDDVNDDKRGTIADMCLGEYFA